jgi:hypothetical protein
MLNPLFQNHKQSHGYGLKRSGATPLPASAQLGGGGRSVHCAMCMHALLNVNVEYTQLSIKAH